MAESGYLESLIIKNTSTNVPCQTDPEYKAISSNQCSWCAAEFAKNAHTLKRLFFSDRSAFVELYKTCLLEGSIKRRDNNNRQYGENIDNTALLGFYELENYKFETILLNNDPEFIEILPKDLREEFYQRRHVDGDSLDAIIGNIYVMASRHGQSFTIIPLINDLFLILDSHVHNIGLVNRDGLDKYVKHDHGGHTHITLIYGMLQGS